MVGQQIRPQSFGQMMNLGLPIPVVSLLLVAGGGGCVPDEQQQNLTGGYTVLGNPNLGSCERSYLWQASLFERFEFINLGSGSNQEVEFEVPTVGEDGVTLVRSVRENDSGFLELEFNSIQLVDDEDGELVIDSLFFSLALFVEGIDVVGGAEVRVEREGSEPCFEEAELDGLRRPLDTLEVAP